MAAETLLFVLAALLAVPLAWALPRALAFDGVAAVGLIVLAGISPVSAAWLVLSVMITTAAAHLAERMRHRGIVLACATTLIAGVLLASRVVHGWGMITMAYATLRNLHVLAEVWMRHLRAPRLRAMLRYQLFVPVMIVGPINLMPSFERELALRRFHREDLAVGAERALIGLAMATVLISKGVLAIGFWAVALSYHLPPFAAEWLLSAVDWVRIYCVFAGLSSFAIGVARMMGIRIAENFDRPFVSRSLMEFWTRWHISLSNWCRDYVFRPLTAATRQPVLGLAAAMVAIGLWHDTSFYYIAWGLWQAAGIALNRMLIGQARRLRMTVPSRMAAVLGPLAVFAWLSLARPVVHLLARHGLAFLLH